MLKMRFLRRSGRKYEKSRSNGHGVSWGLAKNVRLVCANCEKSRKKCEKMRKIAEKACKKAATYGMIGKLWGGKLWEGVLRNQPLGGAIGQFRGDKNWGKNFRGSKLFRKSTSNFRLSRKSLFIFLCIQPPQFSLDLSHPKYSWKKWRGPCHTTRGPIGPSY